MNLTEAIEIIQSGDIFSCTVISCDLKRETGGKIKHYQQAVICDKYDSKHAKRHKERITGEEYIQESYTRNIYVVADSHVTSIIHSLHLLLLIDVNGEKVML
jgi:hypothetical protein